MKTQKTLSLSLVLTNVVHGHSIININFFKVYNANKFFVISLNLNDIDPQGHSIRIIVVIKGE